MATNKQTIPRFGIDKGQYAALILGRRFTVELTVDKVKAVNKTTATWREKSGLPLAFVSPGPSDEEDTSVAGDCFYAGILLAVVKEGAKPLTVDRSLLNLAAIDQIPTGYWEALESGHRLDIAGDEADEDEGPPTGLFLTPAGWAVATLRLGGKDAESLVTTSSEDTAVGARVSEATLVKIASSTKPLKLFGEYC